VTLIGVVTILFILWSSLPIVERLLQVVGYPRMNLLDPFGF